MHTEVIKIVNQRDVSLEEAPGANSPFPEGENEVTTGDTQQTVTSLENITPDTPSRSSPELEQDEEVDRPEAQLDVEVQTHHPYRLRKRANR